MNEIEKIIISIPLPIWIIIGAIIGWFVGKFLKKFIKPKIAGTLWIIDYGNSIVDYYLEMTEEVPPDKIREYSNLTFNVKIKSKN